ncbi:hypothetical protein [Marivita sp. XM-24bin2]|jgi:hypothetical protein|uniref:hypothetical protein n=1 Tax=unclassified Marivita TaxID=2632480 RepID=UPI000D7A4DC0|nr:hypothetical protein [Marivita sp. XM-24bin2]MCR9110984.1 hypothetical protein [Paracoccaceae bacterium]PWL33349.1 MAG: hypothetical protein DCO97_19995 [Marivita sp. XM-24bin2]
MLTQYDAIILAGHSASEFAYTPRIRFEDVTSGLREKSAARTAENPSRMHIALEPFAYLGTSVQKLLSPFPSCER